MNFFVIVRLFVNLIEIYQQSVFISIWRGGFPPQAVPASNHAPHVSLLGVPWIVKAILSLLLAISAFLYDSFLYILFINFFQIINGHFNIKRMEA